MSYVEGSSVESLGCAAKAFVSRTLISTGALWLLDMDGLHQPMEQLKVSAVASAASLASQKYVENMFIRYGS